MSAYGGAVVRIHPISDMALARIEDRIGYSLDEVIGVLSSEGLTAEEIEGLKANKGSPEALAKISSKAMSPKMLMFMAELCRAGMIPEPDPDCPKCHGKLAQGDEICPDCDIRDGVDELRGFSTIEIGVAIIGASTANWKDVEAFFTARKGQSGAG